MTESFEVITRLVPSYDEIEDGFKGRPDIEMDTAVYITMGLLNRGINPAMEAFEEALQDPDFRSKFSGTLGEAFPDLDDTQACLGALKLDVERANHLESDADFLFLPECLL